MKIVGIFSRFSAIYFEKHLGIKFQKKCVHQILFYSNFYSSSNFIFILYCSSLDLISIFHCFSSIFNLNFVLFFIWLDFCFALFYIWFSVLFCIILHLIWFGLYSSFQIDEIDGIDGRNAIDALIQIIKAPLRGNGKGGINDKIKRSFSFPIIILSSFFLPSLPISFDSF